MPSYNLGCVGDDCRWLALTRLLQFYVSTVSHWSVTVTAGVIRMQYQQVFRFLNNSATDHKVEKKTEAMTQGDKTEKGALGRASPWRFPHAHGYLQRSFQRGFCAQRSRSSYRLRRRAVGFGESVGTGL